ncbi:hypothetical protein CLU79DRAFT_831238 [Phycomyces nitens]|nr:hypothetical protein CLU79DRAFT_831238 [Phycomyces nitens]
MFNRTLAVAARQTARNVRIAPRCLYTVQATGETSRVDTRRPDSRRRDFANNLVRKAYEPKDNLNPSTLVTIDNLPLTVTSEDIKKLVREATQKNGENIKEVVFCRTPSFNFRGRCLVHLNNVEDAASLFNYAHRRLLSGKILKAVFSGNSNESTINTLLAENRTRQLGSLADGTSYSGRAVEIVGFTSHTGNEYVYNKLTHRNVFPIEGVENNLIKLPSLKGAASSKFLVKFGTEAEAWRCVRTFHNTKHTMHKNTSREYQLRASVIY